MTQPRAKSLSEVMADHGYRRVPTIYLPPEDYDMVMYLANKHRPAVNKIKNDWWDESKRRKE
jgi:gamma-glutamylcyclotransferase (GGCT)/AIG2-like uncharacterized protein YtfP